MTHNDSVADVRRTAVVVRRAFCVQALALTSGLVSLFAAGDGDGVLWSWQLLAGLVPAFVLGAMVAMARLRAWVLVAGVYVFGWGIILFFLDGAPFAGAEILAVGACLSGLSSFLLLAPRADLLSLWLPFALHVGAAVERLNRHGAVFAWRENRFAFWDASSMVLVVLGTLFFVAGLAARQAVARAHWLHRPVHVDVPASRAESRGRVVFVALALSMMVFCIAPFVLRTRPVPTSPTADPSSATTLESSSPPHSRDFDAYPIERVLRRLAALIGVVGKQAVQVVVAGAVVGVVLLPLERRRRLTALGSPDPSLPPTERVRRRYLRLLLALKESGVVVDGVNVARCFADGSNNVGVIADRRAFVEVPGLRDAVATWQRACFAGRGLQDDAEERMAEAMAKVVAWTQKQRTLVQVLVAAFQLPPLR
jgi:hypothetical protein